MRVDDPPEVMSPGEPTREDRSECRRFNAEQFVDPLVDATGIAPLFDAPQSARVHNYYGPRLSHCSPPKHFNRLGHCDYCRLFVAWKQSVRWEAVGRGYTCHRSPNSLVQQGVAKLIPGSVR